MGENEIKTEFIPNFNVPAGVLVVLRPYAQLAGHPDRKSSIMRWAVIELARRLADEKQQARIATQTGQNVGQEQPVS